MIINNCFDSHVHWKATGFNSLLLDLKNLNSESDLRKQKEFKSYQGWILGQGWDQNRWPHEKFPSKEILDELYPHTYVAFWRADRHAIWVNSNVLKKIDLLDINNKPTPQSLHDPVGGKIIRDELGVPTGVLIDVAMTPVEKLIPPFEDTKKLLLNGMEKFNRQGITHIRDMSGNLEQWQIQILLDDKKSQTINVDQFFSVDDLKDFEVVLKNALYAKKHSTPNNQLCGIKVFSDGALGSEGAFLSKNYRSGSGVGLQLITSKELKKILKEVWTQGLELAVHAIGDAAVHLVTLSANDVWENGSQGLLHIEHAEVAQFETLKILKNKNVWIHMQPCHFLSDSKWLFNKLGNLSKAAFPWAEIEMLGIKMFFGSDSPIEEPLIKNTRIAIEEAKNVDIATIKKPYWHYHEHIKNTPQTYTKFDSDNPIEVFFRGMKII